jgi:hypothetical protein
LFITSNLADIIKQMFAWPFCFCWHKVCTIICVISCLLDVLSYEQNILDEQLLSLFSKSVASVCYIGYSTGLIFTTPEKFEMNRKRSPTIQPHLYDYTRYTKLLFQLLSFSGCETYFKITQGRAQIEREIFAFYGS